MGSDAQNAINVNAFKSLLGAMDYLKVCTRFSVDLGVPADIRFRDFYQLHICC